MKAGQLLAQVDESILQPQVDRLAASLEEAKANAGLAAAEYGRAQGVEAAGALSKEDIEKRRAAAVTAAAEVKVAAAQLAEYQARLSHTQVRAPVDGVVLTRAAEVGQIVTPGGNAMFRLARGSEVEMRALVAEQDLPSLHVGQSSDVYLTGVDKPFAGKVRLLGAVIDPQTRLGEVRIQLSAGSAAAAGRVRARRSDGGQGRAAGAAADRGAVGRQGHLRAGGERRQSRRAPRRARVRHQRHGPGDLLGPDRQERVIMTAAGFLRVGERVEVAAPKAL